MKYFLLLLALFIAALNFNLILKPLHLVTGGTQGLAIILNHLLKIKPTSIIFLINITALILSYFFLTPQNTKSAILSSLAYPFFVKITSSIFFLPLPNILNAIIAGIICGITGGVIYKLGFSSGGTTIINLLLHQYLNLKISFANFIVNTLIIGAGFFFFGLRKTIYSLIVIIIGSFLIKIILKEKKEAISQNNF